MINNPGFYCVCVEAESFFDTKGMKIIKGKLKNKTYNSRKRKKEEACKDIMVFLNYSQEPWQQPGEDDKNKNHFGNNSL